jgi:hypothetical protein
MIGCLMPATPSGATGPRPSSLLAHSGGLRGSNTFMLARLDRINWAILFNSDGDRAGNNYTDSLMAALNGIANTQIKDWPEGDLYPRVAL